MGMDAEKRGDGHWPTTCECCSACPPMAPCSHTHDKPGVVPKENIVGKLLDSMQQMEHCHKMRRAQHEGSLLITQSREKCSYVRRAVPEYVVVLRAQMHVGLESSGFFRFQAPESGAKRRQSHAKRLKKTAKLMFRF